MSDKFPSDGNPHPDGVPLCGTYNTPPCPEALVHIERNRLIHQIAATRTDRERITRAAKVVDAYLVNALRNARELARIAQVGHAATAGFEFAEIEVETEVVETIIKHGR